MLFRSIAASANVNIPQRVDAILERFPVLRRKGQQQAGTLSGGEQKLLEIARSLLLDPHLMLIDEPSIGLSPMMVQEVFSIIQELRAKGVSVLMIEQNARSALEISDDGLVLELGKAAHVNGFQTLDDHRAQ